MNCCKTAAAPVFAKIPDVCITDPFFGPFIEKVRTVTVADVFTKFLAVGALKNYERIAAGLSGEHAGPPWYHGLICETIRGVSDMLAVRSDEAVERQLDEIIDAIARAQAADPEGWINPYTTLVCPDQRWGLNGGYPGREKDAFLPGNARWQHEIYNAGCLVEAGVHHYMATGKTTLLAVAVKMANYLCNHVGPAPKWKVVCEHALPEMALVELEMLFDREPALAEAVGAKRGAYLQLAQYLVDQHGSHADRHQYPANFEAYAQDHLPPREQLEAVGHAVRATLFYTGMADVAAAADDDGLRRATAALWKDIVETKLHINGGVGAFKDDERFGDHYELPNNAYLETCAGVGLAFFGASMFRQTEEAAVWDTVENTLHNLIPASLSEDGVHYFYENPLLSDGTIERWSWHTCPCCPPMLLKLVGVMPTYIAAARDGELWLNLFVDSRIAFGDTRLTLQGKQLTITAPAPVTLRVRIPAWAYDFALNVPYTVQKGYAVVDLEAGTTAITMSYEVKIEKLTAHPRVTNNAGRVAIRRGSVLYCCEQATADGQAPDPILADAAPVLQSDGSILCPTESGEPVRLIEYRRWNNRGPLPMAVWLRQEGLTATEAGWENRLYRTWKAY